MRTFVVYSARFSIRLSKKDVLHLLPFTFHILYISPFAYSILTGHIQWTEIFSSVDKQTYFYNYGALGDNFHVLFRLSLMIVYAFMTWKLYLSKNYRDFVAKNQDL
jgi:hypothetical protein